MEEVLIRCIVKYEFKKFFIGKDFNKNWYIIYKNKLNTYFKVGEDYNFFANVSKGFLFRKAVPVEVSLYA